MPIETRYAPIDLSLFHHTLEEKIHREVSPFISINSDVFWNLFDCGFEQLEYQDFRESQLYGYLEEHIPTEQLTRLFGWIQTTVNKILDRHSPYLGDSRYDYPITVYDNDNFNYTIVHGVEIPDAGG